MKYYICDDDDSVWAVDDDGVVYGMLVNGKLKETNEIAFDGMKWHECSVKEAVEGAKLYHSYFQKLKK